MIEQKIKTYASRFEERIGSLLGNTDKPYSVVYDACRYSLLLGGKRLRPFLLNEFYGLCSGKGDCFGFEAAIECIHTYSLIHDDLPCMDNDDMRRGKPSCHVRFGEANALLAGDALLTAAFGFATDCTDVESENVLKSVKLLSHFAGIEGMIGGQTVDLLYEGKETDENILNLICSLKTGALIKASCLIGCTLAGADDKHLRAAEAFAEKLGLAFQIVDDILDEVGNEEKLGKPVHSDLENGKNTFVSLLGLEECRRVVSVLTDEAKCSLEIFGDRAADLKELADFLCGRDY